tara:strand:- start:1467 stop:2519 length:1053 start_codon:yes stop_codon:yes gene_type:complete
MNILIEIGHPAHVHMFKNFILSNKEHKILVTARDRKYVSELLDYHNIDYITVGKHKTSLYGKIFTLYHYNKELYRIAKNFNPHIFLSHGSIYAAHISCLLDKTHISFEDTEHSTEQILLYAPFTDIILTSKFFLLDFGKKQIKYDSFHEAFYLHPDYFTPDESVLEDLEIQTNQKIVVLRFISMNASHDILSSGFSSSAKKYLIEKMSKNCKVFVISDEDVGEDLKPFVPEIDPGKFHSLLYYADLCVSDSSTCAVESSILGTPTVHYEKMGDGVLVTEKLGYLDHLSKDYGIFHTFTSQKKAIKLAMKFLSNEDLKKKNRKICNQIFNDKIDGNKLILETINNLNSPIH